MLQNSGTIVRTLQTNVERNGILLLQELGLTSARVMQLCRRWPLKATGV